MIVQRSSVNRNSKNPVSSPRLAWQCHTIFVRTANTGVLFDTVYNWTVHTGKRSSHLIFCTGFTNTDNTSLRADWQKWIPLKLSKHLSRLQYYLVLVIVFFKCPWNHKLCIELGILVLKVNNTVEVILIPNLPDAIKNPFCFILWNGCYLYNINNFQIANFIILLRIYFCHLYLY